VRQGKAFARFWLLFVQSPVEVSVIRSGAPVIADFYTGSEAEPQILSLPDPGDGEYEVVATGVGTGSYQIDLGIYNETAEQGAVTATLNGQTVPGEVDRMRVVVSGDTVSLPPDADPTILGRGGDSGPPSSNKNEEDTPSSFVSQFLPAEGEGGEPRILAPGSRHHSSALGAILAMVIFGAAIYALGRINRSPN
jgi:hypothetical protein